MAAKLLSTTFNTMVFMQVYATIRAFCGCILDSPWDYVQKLCCDLCSSEDTYMQQSFQFSVGIFFGIFMNF